MTRVLIAARADVNFDVTGAEIGGVKVDVTGLDLCITSGSLEMVKLLVEAAADVNRRDILGSVSDSDLRPDPT